MGHLHNYSPLCSDFTERSNVLSQERAVFFYTSNMQLYSGPIIKCKGPYHLFTVAPSSYTTISLAKIRNTLTTYSNIVDSSSFNRFAWFTALEPGS